MEKIIRDVGGSVLLVGEGDFSFTVSLKSHFNETNINIVTSSYHQLGSEYYKPAEQQDIGDNRKRRSRYLDGSAKNLEELKTCGVKILGGIDATQLHEDQQLLDTKFTHIIFNFPHIDGKNNMRLNRKLLKGFFMSCFHLFPSYVYVTLCAGQGGTKFDPVNRIWGNTWQIMAQAAYGNFILTSVKPFPFINHSDYRPTGFRNQNKGFKMDGAWTHIFQPATPLPLPSPPVLSPQQSCLSSCNSHSPLPGSSFTKYQSSSVYIPAHLSTNFDKIRNVLSDTKNIVNKLVTVILSKLESVTGLQQFEMSRCESLLLAATSSSSSSSISLRNAVFEKCKGCSTLVRSDTYSLRDTLIDSMLEDNLLDKSGLCYAVGGIVKFEKDKNWYVPPATAYLAVSFPSHMCTKVKEAMELGVENELPAFSFIHEGKQHPLFDDVFNLAIKDLERSVGRYLVSDTFSCLEIDLLQLPNTETNKIVSIESQEFIHDISFWKVDVLDELDFLLLLLHICGEVVERVQLVNVWKQPVTELVSHCYRLTYRCRYQALTKEMCAAYNTCFRKHLLSFGFELR